MAAMATNLFFFIRKFFLHGWKAAGVASRIKFIAGLFGITIASVSPVYWAGALGLSPVAAYFVGLFVFALMVAAFLVYLGYLANQTEQANAKASRNFKCDQVTIANLSHTLAKIHNDAGGYGSYAPDLDKDIEDLEFAGGILLDSPVADAYRFFVRDAKYLVLDKRHELGGGLMMPLAEKREVTESLTEHYRLLKEALDRDYAKTSTTVR